MIEILIAVIAGIQAVAVAWIGRRVYKAGRDAATSARQLTNNGGSSALDKLDRIESKLAVDYHRITGLERRLEDHITQSEMIIHLLTKEKK